MAITFGGPQQPINKVRRDPGSIVFGTPYSQEQYRQDATNNQTQLEQDALQAQTQQIVPRVSPIVGNVKGSPLTQSAYEGQALEALRNQFATQQQEAAAQKASRREEYMARETAAMMQSQSTESERDRVASSAEAEKGRSAASALAQMQANTARDLAAQQAAAEAALQQGSFTGQKDILGERARLSDASFQSRFSQVMGPGGAPMSTIGHGTSLVGNETAARAAAFARAKEQAGNTANAAMQALRGLYENQGTMGSTMEAARAGQVIGEAGAGVNQFTRDQLLSDLSRAADIEDLQYQGGITQRGQDVALKQALLALVNGGVIY